MSVHTLDPATLDPVMRSALEEKALAQARLVYDLQNHHGARLIDATRIGDEIDSLHGVLATARLLAILWPVVQNFL